MATWRASFTRAARAGLPGGRTVARRKQGRSGGEPVREERAERTVDDLGRAKNVGNEGTVVRGVEGGDMPALRARDQLADGAALVAHEIDADRNGAPEARW